MGKGDPKPKLQCDKRHDQTITVRVVQVPRNEIHKHCGKHGGGCFKNGVIHIPIIEGLQDHCGVQTLGHEIMHVLGYQHGADD
jgi:hypothetical protein